MMLQYGKTITSEKAHARTICLCSKEWSTSPVSASHIFLKKRDNQHMFPKMETNNLEHHVETELICHSFKPSHVILTVRSSIQVAVAKSIQSTYYSRYKRLVNLNRLAFTLSTFLQVKSSMHKVNFVFLGSVYFT
jgi:hypothetical protein